MWTPDKPQVARESAPWWSDAERQIVMVTRTTSKSNRPAGPFRRAEYGTNYREYKSNVQGRDLEILSLEK